MVLFVQFLVAAAKKLIASKVASKMGPMGKIAGAVMGGGGGMFSSGGGSAFGAAAESGAGDNLMTPKGAVTSMKDGAGKLLGQGEGIASGAGSELNKVHAIGSKQGVDIKFGAMQGPDLEYEKDMANMPQMSFGEKALRTVGQIRSMKGNPLGAMGAMGGIGDTWSGDQMDYMEPGARKAMLEDDKGVNWLRAAGNMTGSNPIGGLFGSVDRQRKSRREEVLRDYYRSVVRGGGAQ